MKNLTKVLMLVLVFAFTVVSKPSAVEAAAAYKDGTYVSEVAGGSMSYKLNVTVSGGSITEASMQVFYGTTELTAEMAKTNESVKGVLEPFEKMCAELVETNDASAITSTDENFLKCVADFEAQAGKATAEAVTSDTAKGSTDDAQATTSDDTKTADKGTAAVAAASDKASGTMPKTGESGMIVIYGIAVLATGAIVLRKKLNKPA